MYKKVQKTFQTLEQTDYVLTKSYRDCIAQMPKEFDE